MQSKKVKNYVKRIERTSIIPPFYQRRRFEIYCKKKQKWQLEKYRGKESIDIELTVNFRYV